MLLGIRLQAQPTDKQRQVLSQWMGCARGIWNAKCNEEKYYNTFARKYYPIGTYAPLDQQYSQFKDRELSPWLYDVPSQILRNSSTNWYKTYIKFIKGECGKPRCKRKDENGSVHLTRELFEFRQCDNGVVRLFIGTKKNNIGYLKIKSHRKYKTPNSLYIKKRHGEYWVSFCYDDEIDESLLFTQKQHLKYLKGTSFEFLEKHVVGIDRGVAIPVQCGADAFDFTDEQKRAKKDKIIKLKRYQRRLARQTNGSNRRYRTKVKISGCHMKVGNIRKDFCHKTSHAIVSKPEYKVIILEDLKTENMTKKAKPKPLANGKWGKNGAAAKSGLNKSILDKGWHQLEEYIKYKSYRLGKSWFKIPAHHTSQECAACGHTHPDNRKSQSRFFCDSCGHTDNSDRNAAEVIKKRAIRLFLDSGTELSKRGVLLDKGCGAISKSLAAKAANASGNEASKKKRNVATSKVAA